jgi:hypothetical protein
MPPAEGTSRIPAKKRLDYLLSLGYLLFFNCLYSRITLRNRFALPGARTSRALFSAREKQQSEDRIFVISHSATE